MRKKERILSLVICLGMAICMMLIGCTDPMSVGRFRATPRTNIILDSLGAVDENPQGFSGARDPRPGDFMVVEKEYVLRPGDQINITILDLFSTGIEWMSQRQITDMGRLTLPYIGTFQAAGLTEVELTDHIKELLSPNIIKDPKVSVVILNSTEKMFSISGVVPAPGRYPIPEVEFRISEALALAGGYPQNNANYAYVIRSLSEEYQGVDNLGRQEEKMDRQNSEVPVFMSPAPGTPGEKELSSPPGQKHLEEKTTSPRKEKTITPRQEREELLESIDPTTLNTDPTDKVGAEFMFADTRELYSVTDILQIVPVNQEPPAEPTEDKAFKIIRKEGKFQLSSKTMSESPDEIDTLKEVKPSRFKLPSSQFAAKEFRDYYPDVIRIDLKKLREGDWAQNIIIRPGDDIQVPMNEIGFYYVWGQVQQPGTYQLSGEYTTLTQVLATVGGMTSLAWPSRCDITRRLDGNRQVTQMVDLEKLLAGTHPDYYIKPNDVINIGSHPVSRWISVVRQSFRSTYGFGFVYDRNFADVDFGN